MAGNIIPFRITRNPVLHSVLPIHADDNANMDHEQTDTVQARELARLAREKGFRGCFRDNGQLNIRALAAKLSELANVKVHQSTLHRLATGHLTGKPQTLAPIAAAFGMTAPEFWTLMNPQQAKLSGAGLPPAARELWEELERLPKPFQDLIRQQIKWYAENMSLYPDLMQFTTGQATELAERLRAERIKTKRAAKPYPR